jgi:hypothetical protein
VIAAIVQAALGLLIVLLSQLGFWATLRAGSFLGALGANVAFWCLAFPAWTAAGRRWWRRSATPDTALALLLIALTAVAFTLAQTELTEKARNAWGWVGMSGVAVGLVATLLATLRMRALRAAAHAPGEVADTELGPKPVTVLLIAAVILALALAVFAWLIAANVHATR